MKFLKPALRPLLLPVLLSLVLPPFVTSGQTPAPAPAPGAAASGQAQAQPAAGTPGDSIDSMCKMIPEGKRNLKVRIPGFEATGRLSSMVNAAAMTRVNGQEMFSENMKIELFSKDGPKENMRIDLLTSTYHMDNKLLTSNERSRVSRSDFQMEGDSMEYDTVNSQGRMTGHVEVIIFDTASFGKKTNEPAKEPAKQPPPPGK